MLEAPLKTFVLYVLPCIRLKSDPKICMFFSTTQTFDIQADLINPSNSRFEHFDVSCSPIERFLL